MDAGGSAQWWNFSGFDTKLRERKAHKNKH